MSSFTSEKAKEGNRRRLRRYRATHKKQAHEYYLSHKHPCLDCGKLIDRKAQYCVPCWGKVNSKENHYSWTGGRYKTAHGYIKVLLVSGNYFFSMADTHGYVLEHRLIIAQQLGRCLLKTENVHHKNGVRDDNRLENLELISPNNHTLKTMLCNQCGLRKEIRLLQWQIKELTHQLQGRFIA